MAIESVGSPAADFGAVAPIEQPQIDTTADVGGDVGGDVAPAIDNPDVNNWNGDSNFEAASDAGPVDLSGAATPTAASGPSTEDWSSFFNSGFNEGYGSTYEQRNPLEIDNDGQVDPALRDAYFQGVASGQDRAKQEIGDAMRADAARQAEEAARAEAQAALPPLGTLSQRYESNGDPGAVSTGNGDRGGVSYGAYQFESNYGSVQGFVSSLKDTHPQFYDALKDKQAGSPAFSEAWKQLAKDNPDEFLKAQHDYIQQRYYEPAKADANQTAPGLNLNDRSRALNDVLWSTAVQHGSGGAVGIVEDALAGKDVSKMSDADIIKAIYAERGRTDRSGTLVHFSGNSAAVQQAVANRFVAEQRDALNALQAEGRR